jgi:hypothetical protein
LESLPSPPSALALTVLGLLLVADDSDPAPRLRLDAAYLPKATKNALGTWMLIFFFALGFATKEMRATRCFFFFWPIPCRWLPAAVRAPEPTRTPHTRFFFLV